MPERPRYRKRGQTLSSKPSDSAHLPAKELFRLYGRIAARRARWRDHGHRAALRGRRFDLRIHSRRRADHAIGARELIAQRTANWLFYFEIAAGIDRRRRLRTRLRIVAVFGGSRGLRLR